MTRTSILRGAADLLRLFPAEEPAGPISVSEQRGNLDRYFATASVYLTHAFTKDLDPKLGSYAPLYRDLWEDMASARRSTMKLPTMGQAFVEERKKA
jgi:hypothetical protein